MFGTIKLKEALKVVLKWFIKSTNLNPLEVLAQLDIGLLKDIKCLASQIWVENIWKQYNMLT